MYVYDTAAGTLRPASTRFLLDHNDCEVLSLKGLQEQFLSSLDNVSWLNQQGKDDLRKQLLAQTWTAQELAEAGL